MWRLGIVTSAVAALAFAQTFTFTIGSPVASLDGRSKLAAFVFRTGVAPMRRKRKSTVLPKA